MPTWPPGDDRVWYFICDPKLPAIAAALAASQRRPLAILRLDTLFPSWRRVFGSFFWASVGGQHGSWATALPSMRLLRGRDAVTGTAIGEFAYAGASRLRRGGSAIQVMSPDAGQGLPTHALVRGARRRETIRDRLRRVEVVTADIGPPVGRRG